MWILTAFKINQDYIAANLCINRFDKIPVCKGACFLEKQLNEDQQQQKKYPELKTNEVTLICQDNSIKAPNNFYSFNKYFSYPLFHSTLTSSGYRGSIFHPPDLIV